MATRKSPLPPTQAPPIDDATRAIRKRQLKHIRFLTQMYARL